MMCVWAVWYNAEREREKEREGEREGERERERGRERERERGRERRERDVTLACTVDSPASLVPRPSCRMLKINTSIVGPVPQTVLVYRRWRIIIHI